MSVALALAAIVLAVSWAYEPALGAAFVFDDRPAITENVSLQSWSSVWHPPPGSPVSGRPVANLTFALDQWAGHGSVGYHAVNILIHLAATLLLFGIVRRTVVAAGLATAERAHWQAFVVSAVWAVHPLNTAAVVYAVQRVESLMAVFYLLTLYCAIRGAHSVRRRWWCVAAVAASALAMGTKEAAVTAPPVVWLWYVVFDRAPWNPINDRDRRAFYAALAGTWAVLIGLVWAGSEATAALSAATTGERAFGWTPWNYLLTQFTVVVHYIRLAVFPTPLALDYYGWPRADSLAAVWPDVLLLCALIAATVLGLIRRHPLGFAGAWLFLILAPTSSILPIPTEIAAEHRMYLPAVAVVAVIEWALVALYVKLPVSRSSVRVSATAGLALVIAVLGVGTRARAQDYSDAASLWRDTVSKRPDNARARINYGILLVSAGRYEEAEAQMRAAEPLWADDETRAQVEVQLGAALCAEGRCTEGIQHVERALQLNPGMADADPVLAQAFSDAGDLRRALFYFRRAAAKSPNNAVLLTRAAWLFATAPGDSLRDPALAERLATQAVHLTGRMDFTALESLAAAYAAQGRMVEAVAAAREAAERAEAVNDSAAAAILRRQAEAYRLAR